MSGGEKEKNVKIKILLPAPSAKNEIFYFLMSNIGTCKKFVLIKKKVRSFIFVFEKKR